ncbi:MAG: hydroxymethylglutaryl-CoA lyase [Bdellovibrionota bacterium]
MKSIRINEVGPRDGLQNESSPISVEDKIVLIQKLVEAGLKSLELTSMVSPKAIPQLADAQDVLNKLEVQSSFHGSVLVPNEKGMERLLPLTKTKPFISTVAVFTAASESFTQQNIRCSIEESLQRFESVCNLAKNNGLRIRGYISTSFYCPFEGRVDPAKVLPLARRLLDMGCYEVSIGDTIGKAVPKEIEEVFSLLTSVIDPNLLAGHFHDTYGMAIANVEQALRLGVTSFDSSVGGLGGCPYAPGASGNLATEDLVYFLDHMGFDHGVDLQTLMKATSFIQSKVHHAMPSKVFQALRGSIK